MSENDKPPPYSAVAPQSQSMSGPAPPPGYQPYPVQPTVPLVNPYGTNYGATTITVQPIPATQVIVVGGCPACRVGVLEDEFTILGLLCAVLFFPIGILCCLACRQRRCPNCGAIYA